MPTVNCPSRALAHGGKLAGLPFPRATACVLENSMSQLLGRENRSIRQSVHRTAAVAETADLSAQPVPTHPSSSLSVPLTCRQGA